jgi:hypothetical protein
MKIHIDPVQATRNAFDKEIFEELDIIAFLNEHPDVKKRLLNEIASTKAFEKRKIEQEKQFKNAKQVTCGVYDCQELRNELVPMCNSCHADYLDDPDAYK